ncbi:acyl-CoA ligase (AMP-forming), exosortase A system-associated [Parachitinimonas caeni]|uniref:Acyl-CoA ligase (AMP-forming), exosortase A system-associated n=1 Tax=Parachitinimonas caeni TaxID=3031301 RepID=A0ABT7E0U5_9NEIS|nr:acyl-CoA ligase (AMP-forming), exosortase A system-associated [Parachitinimonas caeni]MDK2125946.1 acyl-CoA ligase (AMP-forming), exosortase A system-associated [Parachitinimonas caeni]
MRYQDIHLLQHLIEHSARILPGRTALTLGADSLDYAGLAGLVERFAAGALRLGLARQERVAVFLAKGFEHVAACFGTASAGGVFVPLNPLLKPEQVAYILRDCNVKMLVTSSIRYDQLKSALADCPDLREVVLIDGQPGAPRVAGVNEHRWSEVIAAAEPAPACHRVIDSDMVAILYTSGSTGKPKGVVLSHRNMVTGAKSVASYLGNSEGDTILSALPLSFDAGFSQLTTAFLVGARVVLLNYLTAQEVVTVMAKEKVTGLTGVPPLWMQLAQIEWPAEAAASLRYFANTGGKMPRPTLDALRAKAPTAKPYLMYGLTEAFRSTYLPPEEVDRRPDSIGKAIPNAEILVLDDDGQPCGPNQPGELVHRGPLVSLGYWNDVAKTAERFKPLPGREGGLVLPEMAVFSGDTVRMDEDGFLYFVSRRDEMIKTSGYRVSPTEIEEILYATQVVAEVAAFGIEHATLGQAIAVVAWPKADAEVTVASLQALCRQRLPAYMVPSRIELVTEALPRNPNGKIDRKLLAERLQQTQELTA